MMNITFDVQVVLPIIFLILAVYIECSTALLCYSCYDVTNNEDCLNVTQCGDNEVCFTQSDGIDTGLVKHTLGCRKVKTLPTTNEPGRFTFCSRECQSDLCNLNLCALKAAPDRPPRCLSCAFVRRPDVCDHVKICNQNEVCYVDEFRSFGEVRYRLGCVQKQMCVKMQSVSSAQLAVGKRSPTPSSPCSRCCTGDHCNDYACTDINKVQGELMSLSKLASHICTDSAPDMCTAYGTLSKDSCRLEVVQKSCGKSCGTCAHIEWSNWQAWSKCTQSCGSQGNHNRHRGCVFKLDSLQGVTCVDTSSETKECNRKHCPVDGKWCYESRNHCTVGSSGYGWSCSSSQDRTKCNCPAPAYGGKHCS